MHTARVLAALLAAAMIFGASTSARAANCVCRLYHATHNPNGFCQFYSSFCNNGVMTYGPYDDYHGSSTGPSCNVCNCVGSHCRTLGLLAAGEEPVGEETPAEETAAKKMEFDTKLLVKDEDTTVIVAVKFAKIKKVGSDTEIYAKLYRLRVDPPDVVGGEHPEEYPPIFMDVGFEINRGGIGGHIDEYVNGKFERIDIDENSYKEGLYEDADKFGGYLARIAVGGIKYTVHTNTPLE
jgi:hypothetical protein